MFTRPQPIASGALLLAVALSLAACTDSEGPTATPEPVTSVVTVTESPTMTPAPPREESTPRPQAEDAAPTQDCSTDGAAAIADGARRIAPPLSYNPDVPWAFEGKTNYNTCSDLSYAVLVTQGATASSPYQLLLFHRGRFLGTGTRCNLGYQTVTGSTGSSVDVDYRYLNPDDISARPTGQFALSFAWTGSGVQMNGTIPDRVRGSQC